MNTITVPITKHASCKYIEEEEEEKSKRQREKHIDR
jgi:hypothetical protein